MRTTVEQMTDEALLAACRRLPWEQQLDGIGCGLSLAISLAIAIGTLVTLGSEAWFLALISFIGIGFLLSSFFDHAVNFRSRKHQAELLRRYTPRKLPQDAETAKQYFAIDDPPDWVLAMIGHGLPHGGTQSIEVKWWQTEPEHGILLTEFISQIDFRKNPPLSAESGEDALTSEDFAPLRSLLPDVEKAEEKEIFSTVIDGFPCTLVVVRREPFTMRSFHCNLAGIPESSASHPAPQIMNVMLGMSEGLVTQPVIFGWSDPFGSIGIGGV